MIAEFGGGGSEYGIPASWIAFSVANSPVLLYCTRNNHHFLAAKYIDQHVSLDVKLTLPNFYY